MESNLPINKKVYPAGKRYYHLSIRQQKYKTNRLAGMNQYNAARAAGYAETYSRQACRIEKLEQVSMRDAFERAGLTDKAIVKHALEGMKASKISVTTPEPGDQASEVICIPDWNARHKYFNTVMDITGRIKQKVEHSGNVVGETKIYIITGANAGSQSDAQRIPKEISI